ncbi:carbon-nitrogen hydrolase [Hypoxylon fragiforme]|uniref:carbon-nitrogen hydrolase n=1 Tax=Hypoxylon fragiforme TaxID=63214 RepID=UPI0020C5EF20|nr:carbon-nitrogen hydrolase [Hypoxylon fragiforme]KAI2611247.1 carbon-nitrogen hydrolase [Hypoxylon fragiforme]
MAKAAVGQICSSNSMAHNLEQCVKLVGQAAAAGAKILFLPEASDYIGTTPQESLSLAKPVATSPFVTGLRSAAAQHKLAIHVGIHVPVSVKPAPTLTTTTSPIPQSSEDNPPPVSAAAAEPKTKLYNRTIYILPDGTLHPSASYDKLHLFDYPSASLRESSTTQPGSSFTPPFASPIGLLGSLICFDLRFPEAAIYLTTPAPSPINNPDPPTTTTTTTKPQPKPQPKPFPAPAQILLYPSAFTTPTGRAHWEPLLRARAIETQSWVIASAQVGLHNPGRSPRLSYGRSMVVDPWGKVVCVLKGVRETGGGGEEKVEVEVEDGAVGQLGIVDVDLGQWERIRAQMPLVRRT